MNFYGHIRDVVPQGQVALRLPAGSTVADLLRRLREELGEPFQERVLEADGRPQPSVRLMVEGEVVDSVEQPLGGDEVRVAVAIIPPIMGGATL